MANRCPDCDAPFPTREDEEHAEGGCECERCQSLCWREWSCDCCHREPHDWRGEALALREEVALLRELEREARRGLDYFRGPERMAIGKVLGEIWKRRTDKLGAISRG